MTALHEQTARWDGATSQKDNIKAFLIRGWLLALSMAAGVVVWATMTPIAGAVLSQGFVVVDTHVKKVQHQSGGTIAQILVKDGDRVNASDVVLRLDDTVAHANLQVIVKQLDGLAIRQARLAAERDGAEQFQVPKALASRLSNADGAKLAASEESLFESRRSARLGQKAQLLEQRSQSQNEVVGLEAQLAAKEQELVLVRKELDGLEELEAKRYVTASKVMAQRREQARLAGERGQLISSVARTKGKISEIELKVIQIEQDLRTEVTKELNDIEAKVAELRERRIAAQDLLDHIEVKAPQSGIVNQLSVHTVGGVVSAGEAVMLIVPEDDKLIVEARIAPQDIDHVHPGQTAFVRFAAFNQRTTPEFKGVVGTLSADLVKDADTRQSYYLARLVLDDSELRKRKDLKLLPGMPAEVHLNTGERSALSYFLKPIEDQFAKAFREP